MISFDAFDEDRVTCDVVGTKRQDPLITRRLVPGASLGHARELDDDQLAGPGAFTNLDRAAVDDELARKRIERGLNLFQVLQNFGVPINLPQMSERIGRHDFPPRLRQSIGSGDLQRMRMCFSSRSELKGRENVHDESDRDDEQSRNRCELTPEDHQYDGARRYPETIGERE